MREFKRKKKSLVRISLFNQMRTKPAIVPNGGKFHGS